MDQQRAARRLTRFSALGVTCTRSGPGATRWHHGDLGVCLLGSLPNTTGGGGRYERRWIGLDAARDHAVGGADRPGVLGSLLGRPPSGRWRDTLEIEHPTLVRCARGAAISAEARGADT